MTPAEYRDAIAALGLTQVGAADLLGVDARTSRRWISGERKVDPTAERFLRFLIHARISPKRVERVLGFLGL
jgi:DNA-binding transcriptional regulator YiaG